MQVRLPSRRHVASAIKDQGNAFLDAVLIIICMFICYMAIRDLDMHLFLEQADEYLDAFMPSLFDQLMVVSLLAVIGLFIFGLRRLQDQRKEIAARRHAEDQAQRLAFADPLTGLPNRRQFQERLSAALADLGPGEHVVMMMIDLDRFKPVNDAFGHAAGDQVLIEFARRSREIAGPEPVLARFGGDEFALFISEVSDLDEPARLARRLLGVFEEPFEAADVQVTLNASIGISMVPMDSTQPEELIRRADIALFKAKAGGRGNFRVFEAEMDAFLQKRARLERDLREAMAGERIKCHYQPIVDLENNSIVGFEALARWSHPIYGDVPPDQFIKIAEDSGFIIPLSMQLLRVAALDASHWPPHLRLCVNLSHVQLSDPMLVARFLKVLGEAGLSPSRVEVEITEHALLNDLVAARQALAGFSEVGVRIALDDFGTGNSSLQHLRAFQFDRLKIDRTFVLGMKDSVPDVSVVKAILGLAKALGMPVTAEGIESQESIDLLLNEGCSEGQGFKFSKAVPQSEALMLVAESLATRATA